MNNDKQIKISEGSSRKATYWADKAYYWSEFVSKLATPSRGTETLEQYLAMTKAMQDDLKDVGGYVGGTLTDNRRKADKVIGRDIVTLDMDNIPAGQTDDILRRVDALKCAYVVYSTRKHSGDRPRLRVIIALDRVCTSDEYQPLARMLAKLIGIEFCDPTTFEAHRLMYWPSCCADSQYVYTYGDYGFVAVDGILAMYANWRNVLEWPQVPGQADPNIRLAAKQGNPVEKNGIVGAFCKTYDVYSAMDKFIPGEYTPCDDGSGRYTYTGGSTAGGAVIYDNGLFLYSHHATDPAGGKLCNAFDLVRCHLFADKDDTAKTDTPANKLPSYVAMCELALQDDGVSYILNKERYDKATSDFEGGIEDSVDWMRQLKKNGEGNITKSMENIYTILENDPHIKGRIIYDNFFSKGFVCGELKWTN